MLGCIHLISAMHSHWFHLSGTSGNIPSVTVVYIGQLTWLVYLIGSVLGGRISHTNADDYDAMDGQLVCRLGQQNSVQCSLVLSGFFFLHKNLP